MRHHEWILHPHFGSPIRIKRWADLDPGEVFQESFFLVAHGVMDALSHQESVARDIYEDISGYRLGPLHGRDRLDALEWEVVRRAFAHGRYVIVPLHPRGISYDQLHAIMPRLAHDKGVAYLPLLNSAMEEAHVTTRLRQAAFLAQLAHESNELSQFVEGATGDAYEGRIDLGNVFPGDGRRFKGRGPIQLTGRSAYRAAGRSLGLDLENHPELVATPEVGFRAAGWFWTMKHINPLADVPDFDAVTRRVNGGLNGKASRDAFYSIAKRVLGITHP